MSNAWKFSEHEYGSFREAQRRGICLAIFEQTANGSLHPQMLLQGPRGPLFA